MVEFKINLHTSVVQEVIKILSLALIFFPFSNKEIIGQCEADQGNENQDGFHLGLFEMSFSQAGQRSTDVDDESLCSLFASVAKDPGRGQ